MRRINAYQETDAVGQASRLAQAARSLTDVTDAPSQVSQNAADIHRAVSAMNAIERSAEEIGAIIELIDSIDFQMLSRNRGKDDASGRRKRRESRARSDAAEAYRTFGAAA